MWYPALYGNLYERLVLYLYLLPSLLLREPPEIRGESQEHFRHRVTDTELEPKLF